MSKVARIELWHVAVPLPATFRPSWIPGFPQNENRFDLVRIFTDDGVEGFAAGPAMGREREGLGSLLGPYIIGEDATDIGAVQQRLRELGYLGWRNFWIEPAFWDIKGKLAGKSACELLTGKPPPASVRAMEKAILSKRVTYDFARLMDGATQVSCSGFGQVMIDQM